MRTEVLILFITNIQHLEQDPEHDGSTQIVIELMNNLISLQD